MKSKNTLNIFPSTLYLVPTPIGNLEDITHRALSVLHGVDLIAAEDTRRTGLLLKYFSIEKCLFSLHLHNEKEKLDILLKKLQRGQSIALVSDAGTPIINDPGYLLVRRCRIDGIRVVPLPGACAAITALSASGLPSDRFCYEGFLPSKHKNRLNRLQFLARETRTLIFYDSTHRLLESLQDIMTILGEKRYVVLARELTKSWESIYGAPVENLISWVQKDKVRRYGEITLIIEGYYKESKMISEKTLHTLKILMKELPLKQAAMLTAKIHNLKKNVIYHHIIHNKE